MPFSSVQSYGFADCESSQFPKRFFLELARGTRIVYERAFLMNLRNSPISRTPPRNIPAIPADLLKGPPAISTIPSPTIKDIPVIEETPEQFEMDM
ncbi:eukaryotic translation initiation factor 4E-binding protein isoform X2 [Athalia rosae]|uniref:eukaryotic translation initiation factor 4E-binding protein isoform X2 n=1 Tax=Athalia rosae TaxID=37344 RepID=UPI0020334650|nr:eukaryotic translation initiation factor 4E-binding protein isoform X2 [Athalia rosae]